MKMTNDSEDDPFFVSSHDYVRSMGRLEGRLDSVEARLNRDDGGGFLEHVEKLAMPFILAFIAMMADCRAQDFQRIQHEQTLAMASHQQAEQANRASTQLKLAVVDKINGELAKGDESSLRRALALVDLVEDAAFQERLVNLIEEASLEIHEEPQSLYPVGDLPWSVIIPEAVGDDRMPEPSRAERPYVFSDVMKSEASDPKSETKAKSAMIKRKKEQVRKRVKDASPEGQEQRGLKLPALDGGLSDGL